MSGYAALIGALFPNSVPYPTSLPSLPIGLEWPRVVRFAPAGSRDAEGETTRETEQSGGLGLRVGREFRLWRGKSHGAGGGRQVLRFLVFQEADIQNSRKWGCFRHRLCENSARNLVLKIRSRRMRCKPRSSIE